jgi:hypothetical protein
MPDSRFRVRHVPGFIYKKIVNYSHGNLFSKNQNITPNLSFLLLLHAFVEEGINPIVGSFGHAISAPI